MGGPGDDEMDLAQEIFFCLSSQPHKVISIVALDAELRVRSAEWDPEAFDGLDVRPGMRLQDLLHPDDREAAVAHLRKVISTGRSAVSTKDRTWRLLPADGDANTPVQVKLTAMWSPLGVVLSVIDYREEAAQELRRRLMEEAAIRIGSSLDVMLTAQQLADVMVPLFCDIAVINLAVEIDDGLEPPLRTGGGDLRLRKAALAPSGYPWPRGYLLPGDRIPEFGPAAVIQTFQAGEPFWLTGRHEITSVVADDPDMVQKLVPVPADHGEQLTVLLIPLVTGALGDGEQGLVLGSAELWWRGRRDVTDDDINVAQGICRRATVSVDNARRHTREIDMVQRLHRSMLPGRVATNVVETADRYVPAAGGASGDWWDVVPLSSRRVALICGDVVGHGVDAAAMMGRLRTAARTLAVLDLPPDELLTHLDDLVIALAAEHPQEGAEGPVGSTCCVVVWDPVRCHLAAATAGHPAPLLVRTDGSAEVLPLEPGPTLGVGWLPFAVTEIEAIDPGSTLLLYSDGLIHDRSRPDIGVGLEALREQVSGLTPADDLDHLADRLMRAASGAEDDATLLAARLRDIGPGCTVAWELSADEAEVSAARRNASDCLAGWGAGEDLIQAARLVVSELVTNAIRYGDGCPVGLRLIHDGTDGSVIFEVSDGANTAPSLKHARVRDENGRGLMIVSQLSGGKWGTRYYHRGKVIWTRIAWEPPPVPEMPMELDLGDLGDLADSGTG